MLHDIKSYTQNLLVKSGRSGRYLAGTGYEKNRPEPEPGFPVAHCTCDVITTSSLSHVPQFIHLITLFEAIAIDC